jgi:hypothetical protein
MNVKALTAAALLLAAAGGAEASCARPAAVPPPVPSGATASEESMKQAHDILQAYVNQLEAYKACLKQQADTAPADTPQELAFTWLAQGDAAIDSASYLAAEFSAALKQFKASHSPDQTAK